MNTAGRKVSRNLYLTNKNADSGQSGEWPALLERAPCGRLRPAELETSSLACCRFFDALQRSREFDVRTTEAGSRLLTPEWAAITADVRLRTDTRLDFRVREETGTLIASARRRTKPLPVGGVGLQLNCQYPSATVTNPELLPANTNAKPYEINIRRSACQPQSRIAAGGVDRPAGIKPAWRSIPLPPSYS